MTEEKWTAMSKKDRFEKLVEYAEEYILNNASDVLKAIRKTDYKNCFELINNIYKPKFRIEDKDNSSIKIVSNKVHNHELDIYDILECFCIELQNQSGRSNAIKYFSYGENQDNKIFKIVKEYYEDNIEKLKDKKWCDLYDSLNKDIRIEKENSKDYKNACKNCKNFKTCSKQSSHNYGWREYSRGLTDVFSYISDLTIEDFKKDIQEINNTENSDDRKEILKRLEKKVHSLGQELVYDFFKELCCGNLVKPDVHIKYLYKEIIKGEKNNSYDIAEDIISMCKELQKIKKYKNYTPYYIDKILWLCCTGNFYDDKITINKMTRENFIYTYYTSNN